MNTYILQKDLPEAKAGTEYLICVDGKVFYANKIFALENGAWFKSLYSKELAENTPEWFKLKDEKIVVDKFDEEPDNYYKFHLTNNGWLGKQHILNVIKAIEFIINKNGIVNEFTPYIGITKKYTEEDMRKCFGAGFELSKDYSKTPTPFEDYIRSLDKNHCTMNEFPKRIKLKKESYKKYGVDPNVTGEYKLVGQFYNGVVSTPHLFSPTFAASIMETNPNDFEIINNE